MRKLWPEVPPEQMTSRARWYLLTLCGYCVGMAVGLILLPDWFQTPNFRIVAAMMPGHELGWGVLHLFVGFVAFYSGWRGCGTNAYRALISASVIVGVWATGFDWAVIKALAPAHWSDVFRLMYQGHFAQAHQLFVDTTTRAGWSGAVVYTSVVFSHIVQARQPLRSPFDPVLRRLDEK